MAEKQTQEIVKQLVELLRGGNAHATLERATENFPEHLRGTVPGHLPYSAWQLLEHLRITQRDILDFSSPPPDGYKSLEWPADYWPATPSPPTPGSWDDTLNAIHSDRDRFISLLTRRDVDLFARFSWGDGQNLLREALLIADHNSYHIGELIVLRRVLNIWDS